MHFSKERQTLVTSMFFICFPVVCSLPRVATTVIYDAIVGFTLMDIYYVEKGS